MHRLLAALLGVTCVLGCPRTQREHDAAADAGTRDSAVDAAGDADDTCPLLAGIRESCRPRCGDIDCPEDERCAPSLGFCLPQVRSSCVSNLRSGPDGFSVHCADGTYCVTSDSLDDELARGPCTGLAECLDAPRFGLTCFHYDRSVVTAAPPDAECPAPVDARTPFCGASCPTECADIDLGDDIVRTNGCIGVNAERGLGLCAFDRCRPGHPALDDARWYDGDVTCLTPLAEDAPDWGWFTYRDACRAYRALHPEAFECLGFDGEPI